MSLVVQWVMQIIVFILIATLIELITPDNMMKRYVNLVVGLILILIFAQPLLYFLNVDLSSKLNQIEATMFEDNDTLNETKSLLESQKKDIQAEQDAYILSKVKEQLINEASPLLFEQFNVKITDIQFTFHNEQADKYDDLNEVTVYVQQHEQKQSSEIDPIVIEFDGDQNESINLNKLSSDIRTELQDIWDLHDKKINIKWEGGTS